MNDLAAASNSLGTLQTLIDRDMEANCVRNAGSHSRNLLRVKRGIHMVKALFEHILVSEYVLQLISIFFFFPVIALS